MDWRVQIRRENAQGHPLDPLRWPIYIIESVGFNTNQQIVQLPVGLLALLVEHCTGITEAIGSNPYGPEFVFQVFAFKHSKLPCYPLRKSCLPKLNWNFGQLDSGFGEQDFGRDDSGDSTGYPRSTTDSLETCTPFTPWICPRVGWAMAGLGLSVLFPW